MDPGSPPLSSDDDALLQRARALPVGERERFLSQHVEDPARRRAFARRIAECDLTQTWRSPAAGTGDESQPRSDEREATPAEGSLAGAQGSTDPVPAGSNAGDYVSLPTIAMERPGPSADGVSIGQIGEYDLLERVARGGMGVVFKARHRVLRRLVAIKIPLASQLEDADDGEGEARFLREARAAAQLRHPHICPIFEVGHAGKQPFIALGYIDGPTLRQHASEARPNAHAAAEIMAKVARAVHYAHQHNVIHRDIKPSNIMLEAESGEPVLLDFGLAKQLSEGESQVTKSGQVMGTPVYMSPEQAAGRHEQIGPLTDVYSLGAVLYELLTGRPPFDGSTGEVILQVQTDLPPPPRKLAPSIHRDLETICLKAMAKKPAARYASAEALAADLQRFTAGEAILAKREGIARRSVRLARRHARLAAAVLLVAAIGAAAASYFAYGAREASQMAAIHQRFRDALQETAWDEPHRRHMESLADELALLNPPAAEEMRAENYRGLAAHLRQRIANAAALEESDFSQLEAGIAWLNERDSTSAAALMRQLQARQRTWQEVFHLEAPFENRPEVFALGDRLTADGSLLKFRPAGLPEDSDGEPLLTGVPSAGNVRLKAVFEADWKEAGQIGLLLHASDQRGYLFRLTAPAQPSDPAGGGRFWQCIEADAAIEVEILRDGLLLRQTSVPAGEVANPQTGRLSLEATAEGERVTFRVGQQPALAFEDVYPYVGGTNQHFGLVWPAEASLVSLQALRQPLPVAPSPLEQGDELFAQEQWTAALSQYRQQTGLADDEKVRDRARYQEALCRARLGEDGRAVDILESLSQASDQRLRLLAGCQLWLLHLRNSRYAEAEVVFESLESQYGFEQLAMLVPEADRRDILASTYRGMIGLNLYRFTDENLRFLEQSHRIQQLLSPDLSAMERGMQTWQLLRGYHVAGELAKGVRLAQGHLAEGAGPDLIQGGSIISECSWMLRQRGQLQEAREIINRHLGDRAQADEWQLRLLVERARISAAEGKWEAAADDLDFFLASPSCGALYREFSAACLMRGLLHERDGQAGQAQELWRRGLYESWLAEHKPHEVGPFLAAGMHAGHALFLAALCGDRTAKEVAELAVQALQIGGAGAGPTAQLAHQYADLLAPAISNVARSERGKQVIWQFAFQEGSLKELLYNPASLIFLEVTREGAAPGDWLTEEEQIIWDLASAGLDSYAAGEIDMPQAVRLMLTWKGANNFFGWKGAAPSLEAKLRGPMAYVLAHRFLNLGKPHDARQFLQTALADAPEGSTLRLLAEAKLAEMPASGTEVDSPD